MKVDSTILVEDAKYFNSAYDAILVKPYAVQNLVSLEINEGLPVYLRSSFTATARLRIYFTRANGIRDSVDRDLTINYDTANAYKARSTYLFNDAYRVEVKVLQLTKNVSWNVWSALKVVNQLQSFPQYQFSCSAQVINQVNDSALAANTDLDELPVWWQSVTGADEYDLEWTYIDAVALTDGLYGNSQSPDVARIFENNATRVTIRGTSYRIPLFYDNKGHLFYRVRAVQQEKGGARKEAYWSSNVGAGLGRFNYDGHQRDLNWQATTSFAEEGKRKTIVKYFDGSLRERQIVTKDNTTNRTIVGETLYDYQGRSAIQVLPAPTLSSVIGYTRNLNRGLNGVAYDKSIYDTLPSPDLYCTMQGIAMDTSSGASRYYSPANELRDSGIYKFIPNAKGYPFIETEYTQDNTVRIARQSGVGENFRIGSGHETKYYYGTPDQRELDALFGTEVGDYTHYTKNMVRDANGQYSVSYLDMKGRTIATALAGTPPDSIKLAKLPSNIPVTRTEDLLDRKSPVLRGSLLESKKGLLVPMAGNHTFTYKLDPQTLQLEGANTSNFCYDCLYDLQITITDDCNNQKLGGKAFDTLVRNFSLSQIDTTCSKDSGFAVTFTKWLQEGSYEVTKKLSISKYAMDFYRDSVFKKNNLVKSLENFITEQRQVVMNQLQCKPSCATCELNLGSWDTYWQEFKDKSGVGADSALYRTQAETAYQYALRECAELCDPPNEAGEIRKAMMIDMIPSSGQYANVDNAEDIYSVFFNSQDGEMPDTAAAYTLITDYRDENGNLDMVYDEGAGKLVPPGQLSPALFAQKFKASWAEALLSKHPEYVKLQKYDLLKESHVWDRRFEAVETYAEAKKRGYLNPGNTGTSPYNLFSGTVGSIEVDPLFSLRNDTFKARLLDSLVKYRKKDGVFVSMWGVASAAAMCDGTVGCYNIYLNNNYAFLPDSMCVGELNMAWLSFRQMYLDVKRNLVNQWIKANCNNCITTATIMQSGHQPHFSDAWESLALNDVDLPSDAAGAAAWQQKNENALAEYYDGNCRAYATQWLEQLLKCTLYNRDTLEQVIIPKLIDVCKEGADANHQLGSSSVKPSSTSQFRSFEEVMNWFNTSRGIVDLGNCNPFGIVAPMPYDRQVMYSNKPLLNKPDTCECSNISRIYTKYQPVAALFPSFSAYLKTVHKTNISDSVVNILLSMCGVVGSSSDCRFAEAPISLPPLFQCYAGDVCVSCDQFRQVDAAFRSRYPNLLPAAEFSPNDSVQIKANQLYEQFLNYKLGFTKTVFDYLNFSQECHATITTNNTPKHDLERFYDYYRAYRKSLTNEYVNSYTQLWRETWRIGSYLSDQVFATVELARFIDTPGVIRLKPFNGGDKLGMEIYYQSQRDFCFDGEFSGEIRIKAENDYSNPGDISIYPEMIEGDSWNYPFSVTIQPGSGYSYFVRGQQTVVVSDARVNTHFFDTWKNIRYTVTSQKYRVYYNDTLLFEVARPSGHLQYAKLDRFKLHFDYLKSVEMDWFKLYDKNNQLVFNEQFNTTLERARPDTNALCPLPDCKTLFRDYFNYYYFGDESWGYATFDEINEDEYIAKTGRPIEVCDGELCYKGPAYITGYPMTENVKTSVVSSMTTTLDGGLIIAGGVADTATSATTTQSAWLMRTDHKGDVVWKSNYRDSINIIKKVITAMDNSFIAIASSRHQGANKTTILKVPEDGQSWLARQIEGVSAVDIVELVNGEYAALVKTSTGCREGFGVYYFSQWPLTYVNHIFVTTKACPDINPPAGTVWDDVTVSAITEEEDSLLIFGTKSTSNIPGESGFSGCIYKIPKRQLFNPSNPATGAYFPKVYKIGNGTRFLSATTNTTGSVVNAMFTDPSTGKEYPCIIELDNQQQVIKVLKPVFQDGALVNQVVTPVKRGGFAVAWQDTLSGDKHLLKYNNGIQWQRRFGMTDSSSLIGIGIDLDREFSIVSANPQADANKNDVWVIHTDSMGLVSCDSRNSEISFENIAHRRVTDVAALYSQINAATNVTKSVTQGWSATQHLCSDNTCATGSLTLCGRAEPVLQPAMLEEITNCSDSTFFILSSAKELYKAYTDSVMGNFDSNYRAKCLDAYKYESFSVRHTVSEYHYTLYYYDQAGNLAKTVPPAGVRANYDSLWLNSIETARLAGNIKVPAHVLATEYRYNTLNQVVAQRTPDAGGSEFWYDRLGRLALSRNSRQKGMSTTGSRFFSYTRYDELGRITEVGQIRDTSGSVISDTLTRNETILRGWLDNLVKYRGQVTQTVYDTAYIGFGAGDQRLVVQQQNLRNRVSYTTYADSPGVTAAFNQGTFYSYDLHGNVDTLLQDYGQAGTTPNMMNKNGNRWKKMVYEYDLISGKVNSVHYQPGWADQWSHRYTYDASNRLISTETSTNAVIWDKEAQYEYYLHGPLARTTIGAQQVQGLDYAYTLQGWLKGVNSVGMKPNLDMGKDGSIGGLRQYTARDVFGFGLNYFGGDYFPISSLVSPFPGYMAYLPDSAYRPLFNGNISSMAESLDSAHIPGLAFGSTLLYNYKYDQLNRVKQLDTYKGYNGSTNSWSALKMLEQYKERVSYDANGNILQYKRTGNLNGPNALMDDLQYSYYANSNKLKQIIDNAQAGTYSSDIDNQADPENYKYDSTGNLVKDSAEGIREIKWTVYGKIREIIRNPGAANKVSRIVYAYDAQGNRIGKMTERQGTTKKEYTWYVRDAQGNTLAVYTDSTSSADLAQLAPSLTERSIYGSSRLGVYTAVQPVDNGPADTRQSDTAIDRRGLKLYELSNHLGNVLATISDRKQGIITASGDTVASYYYADVRSAQSYYPFGMIMPGRNATTTDCKEELQNNVVELVTNDLNSGVTINGTDIYQNGVRWAPLNTATISYTNNAIRVDNGGGSSDGVVAYLPGSAVEANTTYVIEFDITDKSSGITYFGCQAHTPTNDVYRVTTQKFGTGHHAILFTSPEALPNYIRLRITSNSIAVGSYFVVDNVKIRKFKAVDETTEVATDFDHSTISGGVISGDGMIWKPLNNTITSLGLIGENDKKIRVTCSNTDQAYLKTEIKLAGGNNYLMRVNVAQDALDKRLGLRIYSKTGSTWTQNESQGVFFVGAGDFALNFAQPAGADSARIEFIRSNNGNTYDGYNTPYVIDNFNISRLDTLSLRPVMVCGGCREQEVSLVETKVESNLDSGVTTLSNNRYLHKGLTWQQQANGIVSLVNGTFRVENSGTSSSDGMLVVVPSSMIEPFTTYQMECDILEQSPGITEYNIQVLSQTNDGYRVSIIQSGTGHRSIVFTTGATVGTYVAFRISARPATAGLSFLVDNFSLKKYTTVNQVLVHATDFNSAEVSGTNIVENEHIWKPTDGSGTSLTLIGSTDKKIQVNATNLTNCKLSTDLPVEGNKRYLLKFSASQPNAEKYIFIQLWARTGVGPWTITDQRGFFYIGSGDFQLNFTAPSGADELRVEWVRANSGTPTVAQDWPYTIDNFSLHRVDLVTSVKTMVCDSTGGEQKGLYRYGFNGKENDNEVKGLGNQSDFGARMYDARIGRWLSVDPLQRKYTDLSPYQYCANSPISAKDPDGRLIIFINGMWGSAFGIDEPKEKYWGSSWVSAVQRQIEGAGSKTPRFYDGSMGGVSSIVQKPFQDKTSNTKENRILAGEKAGYADAAAIIGGLDKGETIKIITNSMGTAFERGFTKGILKYQTEENERRTTLNAYIDKLLAPVQEELTSLTEMKAFTNFMTDETKKKLDKDISAINTKINDLVARKKEILNVKIEMVIDLSSHEIDYPDPNAAKSYFMKAAKLNNWEKVFVEERPIGAPAQQIGLNSDGTTQMRCHYGPCAPPSAMPESSTKPKEK
ncbi:hypothetical protein D3H65_12250 [Paraflavitalea soli]|uniref:RHS repeat-associated core domain-containing protein n=1 Tax=Paraflavitalea soli TaxID=2315862 RepID=A0A3B7MLV3_9BACT|nr:hypothetical protein D3H65_12250 [Paraflavitalea soli]